MQLPAFQLFVQQAPPVSQRVELSLSKHQRILLTRAFATDIDSVQGGGGREGGGGGGARADLEGDNGCGKG
jgi:hypothetical protein